MMDTPVSRRGDGMRPENALGARFGNTLLLSVGLLFVASCKEPEGSKLTAWGGEPEFFVTSTETEAGFSLEGTENAPPLGELTKLEVASTETVQVDALSDSGLTPLGSGDEPEVTVEFTVDGGRACRVSVSQLGGRHPVQCEDRKNKKPASGYREACTRLSEEDVAFWVGDNLCQCGGSMVRYDSYASKTEFEDACREKAGSSQDDQTAESAKDEPAANYRPMCSSLYDQNIAEWVGDTLCQCGGSMVKYSRFDDRFAFEKACRDAAQAVQDDTAQDQSQDATSDGGETSAGDESSAAGDFEATCGALYDEGVAAWVGSTICQCGGSMVKYDRYETAQEFEAACREKAR